MPVISLRWRRHHIGNKSEVFETEAECLYPGSTFLGIEGNGGGDSAHVLLRQVVRLFRTIFRFVFAFASEPRKEAIVFVRIGCRRIHFLDNPGKAIAISRYTLTQNIFIMVVIGIIISA